MKLTYIYHSAYAILDDKMSIIIDYYKDSKDKVVENEILKIDKPLYVLCTHSHYDHFNPEIFEWRKKKKNIIYILSKEILETLHTTEKNVTYLDKMETYKDKDISIQAFGSTDIGGSFLLDINDKKIFHAGDLNNWHWNEESTLEEVKEAEDYYSKELNILANEVSHLDLAMFPIDPRLGKDYMKGAEQFINTIKTDILAPMHFDKAYDRLTNFEHIAKSNGCKSISWNKTNQSINF